MKYLILGSLLLVTACAFRTIKQGKEDSLEQLLRSGQNIFIEGQTFTEDVDLTKILEPNPIREGVLQVKTSASITFKNCRFLGQVKAFERNASHQTILTIFQNNVSFLGCEFRSDVTFRACNILGTADFSKSHFFGKVNFEEASFQSNAYFNDCIFYAELRFQNAFFHQKGNFMKTQFDQTVYFQDATFQSEAQFSVTEFKGYADFSLLNCLHHCFFNYSQFQDQSIFSDAHFNKRADFLSVQFKEGNFKNAVFMGNTRFDQSSASKQLLFDHNFFLMGKPDFESFNIGTLELVNIRE